MDTVLDTCLSDSFWEFDVDEIEILLFFDFVPGAEEVDDHVGVLHHALNLFLILVVHAIVDPAAILIGYCVRVGPQTLSSLRCSECLKL
jgi:hypothetical protein